MTKGERLNKAIISKLERVLENTEDILDMKICIEGSAGLAPTITYEIEERIRVEVTNERFEGVRE